jgi:hypothetical protein
MGRREGPHPETAVGQTRHRRKGSGFELEEMRAHDLAGDADIGKTGLGSQRKRSRWVARQQPFVGCKSLCRPMLAPALDRPGIGAEPARTSMDPIRCCSPSGGVERQPSKNEEKPGGRQATGRI